MESVTAWLGDISTTPAFDRLAVLAAAIVVALLVRLLFDRIVAILARRTASTLDDRTVAALRGPVVWSILLAGLAWIAAESPMPDRVHFVVEGVLVTVVALIWAVALLRIGRIGLELVSARVDRLRWVEPKTLPLFDMVLKVAVAGGFLYFVCIAWGIPLTSWLTSAGIVGIAVGFAARDTLANLFSGIFIIADAPYKVGDYVVLDNTLRGVVQEIGMRSTRILTRDDVEVTVPNAVIANAKIVNETGGPHEKMRVRVQVSVAYGSELERVESVLLSTPHGVAHVSPSPEPRVRFREFGDSGLVLELLAWIDEPVYRGLVLHELNSRVYRALLEAGIEIPFPKRDVYIRHQPAADGG
jgi:small-conductance mechanosensitive channel